MWLLPQDSVQSRAALEFMLSHSDALEGHQPGKKARVGFPEAVLKKKKNGGKILPLIIVFLYFSSLLISSEREQETERGKDREGWHPQHGLDAKTCRQPRLAWLTGKCAHSAQGGLRV